jgi:hypothetical protein
VFTTTYSRRWLDAVCSLHSSARILIDTVKFESKEATSRSFVIERKLDRAIRQRLADTVFIH